ncbi:nucleotidyl transferase AbiEii/AbiGii toxin family protein [Parendozoicomonas haliclonae]|uniref:nucleotidyl transferase AbiEii/AbiGii toxin family protein n=1 Tax=Parendozoicomonas haliclonae TaxID=1960125 RepID=UPI0039EF5BA6
MIDISGKLNAGLIELYVDLKKHTDSLNISMLVVGAMARDLVLHYGFGAAIERGTRDVDFAISVSSWEDFSNLRKLLLASGYVAHRKHLHNFSFVSSDGLMWELDVVPFGDIAEKHEISWPPEHEFHMSVLGFPEALSAALQVRICRSPESIISVASPAGICLLKLIAWTDRAVEKRPKDASDVRYLIDSYAKIPSISEALYTENYMELYDFDETLASAVKLGEDAGAIALPETVSALKLTLFENEKNKVHFALDMRSPRRISQPVDTGELFDLLIQGFLSKAEEG